MSSTVLAIGELIGKLIGDLALSVVALADRDGVRLIDAEGSLTVVRFDEGNMA